ncbi:MAG: hypothetical protein A3G75_13680, partial [Verrucomicrobia bacterium RIFCSPLOWO2_12_FULL_64_8]
MNDRPTDLLFVYGTLRRAAGQPAHRLMAEGAELVGHGFVRGHLYAAGEFPTLVSDPQGEPVAGEVYRLFAPQAAFVRLDHYEGFDPASPETSDFRRTPVTVALDDGRTVAAWAYTWNRLILDLTPIPHCDYARFLRENS